MDREYDVPLAEVQIIWDARDNPELPAVEVVRKGHEDDPRYDCSWGACNQDFSDATPDEQLNMLMKQFVHMVVVDKADPEQAHKALMLIPEYRKALADFGSIDPESV